jgi:hypothetical protein
MGSRDMLASVGEITEGTPLQSLDLAAVFAWRDPTRCPLLRYNGALSAAQRAFVHAWAADMLAGGRRIAALPMSTVLRGG